MNPLGRLRELRGKLGNAGVASLALLGGAALFVFLALKPLEARHSQLEQQLARSERQQSASGSAGGRSVRSAAQLQAFYRFLESQEETTDWLARLEAIATAVGVELRSADYRVQQAGARLERYEISLPVAGTYAQIRAFLENGLIQIPMLSLDQVSFRKNAASDGLVQADVHLTLHIVKP